MGSQVSRLSFQTDHAVLSERFVDADEAADAFGINPKTLQRWSRQGIVPAHPIGEGRRKFWRYRISELEAWLHARTARGPTE